MLKTMYVHEHVVPFRPSRTMDAFAGWEEMVEMIRRKMEIKITKAIGKQVDTEISDGEGQKHRDQNLVSVAIAW